MKGIKERTQTKAADAGLPDLEDDPQTIPTVLDTPQFRAAWDDWLAYRRERKLPAYKPRSVAEQINTLATWGHDPAIASIHESIRQQWQGLFEPKAPRLGLPQQPQRPAETPRFNDDDLSHLAKINPARFNQLISQWPTLRSQAKRLGLI